MPLLLAFFAIAFGLSWLIWTPLWLPAFGVTGLPVLPYNHEWGALGPILAALLVTAWSERGAGLAALIRAAIVPRGALVYLAFAALVPLAIAVLGLVIAAVLEGGAPDLAGLLEGRDFPGLPFAGFAAVSILTFGLGEEIGWRGYALPRLQARMHPIAATLLLTLGWAIWHWPTFLYRVGYVDLGAAGTFGWFLSLVTGALILTWLFNRTGGSVLAVILFHGMIDVAFTARAMTATSANVAGFLVTLLGIGALVALWRRPQAVTRLSAV